MKNLHRAGYIGDAIDALFKGVAIVCLIFIPLGLWKLIEIIVWIVRHVRMDVTP